MIQAIRSWHKVFEEFYILSDWKRLVGIHLPEKHWAIGGIASRISYLSNLKGQNGGQCIISIAYIW